MAPENIVNGAYTIPGGIDDLAAGPQDPEWIWDIGFSSLLPIDLDFHLVDGLPSGQEGGPYPVASQPF